VHNWVVPITAGILLGLFIIQSHGTGRLGGLFGPLMLFWFTSIALLGAWQIVHHPSILVALNPWHGVMLFVRDPAHAFVLLGGVVLVVTGGEALYADMGHFGRAPIRRAWFCVVFPALLLNYFGQAAYVLSHPEGAANPFWEVMPGPLRVPMVVVATSAAIIASQALISGAYSLSQQAMQLGYSPRLQIVHTSHTMEGQIYVPEINAVMMLACVLLVIIFKESTALAAMYGLAVTGTMTITSLLLYCVARERWKWSRPAAMLTFVPLLAVDLLFLGSNLLKFTHGGWVALMVASSVFVLMLVWYEGRALLARPAYSLSVPMPVLLDDLKRNAVPRVPGTAVFMAARPGVVPAVLLHHLKHNQVLHERVLMLSVRTDPVPKVDESGRLQVKQTSEGFWEVTGHYGFMEAPDVPDLLRRCAGLGLEVDPELVTYYLGRVVLRTRRGGVMPYWAKRLFAFLYHNERPVTSFFNLPANRVVELGRQLEM
jgi:KUP system potassium uptake protein